MSMSFNSEYDSEIVAIFLEEIDGYLPELEESLAKLHTNAKDKDALEVAHRLAHTIKGTAASLGFNDVSKQGLVLEQVLTPVFEKKAQLTPQSLADCDNHLTVLKMMLAQMHIAASGGAIAEPEPATPAPVAQPVVPAEPAPAIPTAPVVASQPAVPVEPVNTSHTPSEFNLFDDLPPFAPAESFTAQSSHTPSEFNLFDDLPPFAFSDTPDTASNTAAPFEMPSVDNLFPPQSNAGDINDFFTSSLPDLPDISQNEPVPSFEPNTASPFDDFFSAVEKAETPSQISEDIPDWLINHNKPSMHEDLPDWLKASAETTPTADAVKNTPVQPEQLPDWLSNNSFAQAAQQTQQHDLHDAPSSEQLLDLFIEDEPSTVAPSTPISSESLPDWLNDFPAAAPSAENLPPSFAFTQNEPSSASEVLPVLPDWLSDFPTASANEPEAVATSEVGPVVWENLPSVPAVEIPTEPATSVMPESLVSQPVEAATSAPAIAVPESLQEQHAAATSMPTFDSSLDFLDDIFDTPPPLATATLNLNEAAQPAAIETPLSDEAHETHVFRLEVPTVQPENQLEETNVVAQVAPDTAAEAHEVATEATESAASSLPELPELEAATPAIAAEPSLEVPSATPEISAAESSVASEAPSFTLSDEPVANIPLEVPASTLEVPPTDTVVAEVPAELPVATEVPVSDVTHQASAHTDNTETASRTWADEALELFSFDNEETPNFLEASATTAEPQASAQIEDNADNDLPAWLVENNPLFVEPSPTLPEVALPVQATPSENAATSTVESSVENVVATPVAENIATDSATPAASTSNYSLFDLDAKIAPVDVTAEENLDLPPLDDLFDFAEFPFSPPNVQAATSAPVSNDVSMTQAAEPNWDNLDDIFSTSAIDQHIDRLQQQILPEIPSNPAEFEAVPLPSEIAVSDSDLLAHLSPAISVNSDFPAINQDTRRSDSNLNDNSLPDLAEVEALLDILEPAPQMSSPTFSNQFLAEPEPGNIDGLADLSSFDPLMPDLASKQAANEELAGFATSATSEAAAQSAFSLDEVAAALQPLEEVADEPQVEAATFALPEVEGEAHAEDIQPEHYEAELAEAGLVPTTHHEDSAAIAAALQGNISLPAGIEGLTEEELAMAMESGFDFSDFADDDSGFGFDAAPMWLAEAQADIDRLQSILDDDTPLESAGKIRDIAATLRKGAELMELTEITNQLSVIETMVSMVISGDLPNSPNTLTMVKNAYADFIKLVEPYQEAAKAILNPEPATMASGEAMEMPLAEAAVATPPPPTIMAQPPVGVEVDRELAETFAEEAEEHIQNLDVRLAALEKDPNNRELIREIRRTAHTLKGSAAMVGFQVVSQTGHLMEDLLDRLFDGSLEVSEPIIELLFATFNAMDNMVRSLRAGRPEDYNLLVSLRPRYEAVLEAESQAGEEAGGAIIFERKGTSTLSPQTTEAATVAPVEVAATDSGVGAFDTELAVRVPIGRLDGMMNQVGELVINRTVLEQRNQVFDRAVEELKLSINRLQRISRELETRYEVELLKNSSVMTPGVPVGAGNGGGRNRGGDSYLGYSVTPDVSNMGAEFDTLEMDRYTEFHTLSREMSETVSDIAAVQRELDNLRDDLDNISVQQSRLTDDLQDRLVKVRLVPLSNLTPRLYRTVRTVAAQQGKDIEFVVSGDTTQVDKTIFEEIADPLLHLVRNAVDHGIEPNQERLAQGKKLPSIVGFAARTEGSEVVIEVSDDGYGIDMAALKQRGIERGFMSADANPTDEEIYNLMFLPGFSTSQTISEISGRGVGLDVVKANVTRLKGIIEVASQPGKGTTFSIRIPNTLAISRAMLVQAGGYTYAVPLNVVEETTRLEQQAVLPGSEKYGRGSYYRYNGENLPLYELSGLLHLPAHALKLAELQADDDELNNNRRERPLLIITGAQRYALLVDTLVGQQEVVVKPLGNHLKSARGIVGATILGNGQVTLILNVYELVTMDKNQRQLMGGKVGGIRTSGQISDMAAARALSEAEVRERELSALRGDVTDKQVSAKVRRTPVIQVVDDSLSIRKVLSGALEKAGFRVRTSKDGQEALETIQQNSPDLIIMDIEMPRMDGYQLTSILKNDPSYQPIPIVMLTSRAGLKHRQKAEEVGADGFLVKPYKEEELLGIVSELLIRSGS